MSAPPPVSSQLSATPRGPKKVVPLPAVPAGIYAPDTAIRLAAILSEYDKQIIQDANQLRVYITNRLIEISKSGFARDELKALELLGKISDIGLFAEKSEVHITHTASSDLEDIIRSKLGAILGVDKNSLVTDADFEEVEDEEKAEEEAEAEAEAEAEKERKLAAVKSALATPTDIALALQDF